MGNTSCHKQLVPGARAWSINAGILKLELHMAGGNIVAG